MSKIELLITVVLTSVLLGGTISKAYKAGLEAGAKPLEVMQLSNITCTYDFPELETKL